MSNVLQDIGNTLATVAPTIAGLFGGPLASAGVTELEKVLGVTPPAGASVQDRAASLQSMLGGMTSDQIVAVKQADDAFKQKMLDAGVQLAQTDAADRASARSMQMTTKSYLTPTLAVIVVGGFIVMTGLKFAGAVVSTDAMTSDLLTTLRDALMLVLSFYFGSASSVDKQHALIDKALDTTQTVAKAS
jgi:hypothetical protein